MKKILLFMIVSSFINCTFATQIEVIKNYKNEVRSKDKAISLNARAKLAQIYRQQKDFRKALSTLGKNTSIAIFPRLAPAEKIPYLKCLLEFAHIKVLENDLATALPILNWAENNNEDFYKTISCLKYAEILLELGELERAEAYLKTAQKIINKKRKAKPEKSAIGQGAKNINSKAQWNKLYSKGRSVAGIIEQLKFSKKFGKPYSLYVKLRRLKNRINYKNKEEILSEFEQLAEELEKLAPKSQFVDAAKYLKGEALFASLPTEESSEQRKAIKELKKYLQDFIEINPNALYRGESWLLLGKTALELEWDPEEAEKFYAAAYKWFKASRERRDMLSLYAPISDDLKKQITPTKRLTALNSWKRLVFISQDPTKIYNTATAPTWYIAEREKSCAFILGFILFSQGKTEEARTYWKKIMELSPELQSIDPRFPNVHQRLMASCNVGHMAFTKKEKAPIKSNKARLLLQYAEFLYLQEKFDEAIDLFGEIASEQKDIAAKAVAFVGKGNCEENKAGRGSKEKSAANYRWVLAQKKINREYIYGAALYRYGFSLRGVYKGERIAEGLFAEYIKNFPNGRYLRRAKYHLIKCYLFNDKLAEAKKDFKKFGVKKDGYTASIEEAFEFYKQGRIGSKNKKRKQK